MIELRPLCDLAITLGAPLELGHAARGRRRVIPITGGSVTGRLQGTVLPGGADWQTIFPDDTAELEARYTLRLDDGALIDVINHGYRHGPREVLDALARGEAVDPQRYYMRTTPRFETGDPRHAWLNRTVFVGSGARAAATVHLNFFEVL